VSQYRILPLFFAISFEANHHFIRALEVIIAGYATLPCLISALSFFIVIKIIDLSFSV
jgi:hypothetical protein